MGTIGTVLSCFMSFVLIRAAFWLWGRLPLLEAQDHRQMKIEQEAWQDDEKETRLLHYAERQRRKWNYLLNGIFAETIILVLFTLLIVGGQPVAWLVLAMGTVMIGIFVGVAWM